MDVNRTRFLLARSAPELAGVGGGGVWDERGGCLRLPQAQSLVLEPLDAAGADQSLAGASPWLVDRRRQLARVSDDGTGLVVETPTGVEPVFAEPPPGEGGEGGEVGAAVGRVPVLAPHGTFVELAAGPPALVAAAFAGGAEQGVLVVHLVERWTRIVPLDFAPTRLAFGPEGTLWAASRERLVRLAGRPLPTPYAPDPARFEPEPVNPEPLRADEPELLVDVTRLLGLALDPGRADRGAELLLLVRDGNGEVLVRRRALHAGGVLARGPFEDIGLPADAGVLPAPTDLAVLGSGRVALLSVPPAPARPRFDAVVLELPGADAAPGARARLVRERHPLWKPSSPRFVGGLDGTVRYAADGRPTELTPLADARFLPEAWHIVPKVFDSSSSDTVWHRLYLDAELPPGGDLEVWILASGDRADVEAVDGVAPPRDAQAARAAGWIRQPALVHESRASELPGYAGMPAPRPDTRGLFGLLVQHEEGDVRQLRARYARVMLRMRSDGRRSPLVHALRLWTPRYDYQERYLPAHWRVERAREVEFGAAHPADLRERLLALLESELSPLERELASAERFVDAYATPSGFLSGLLDNLGSRTPRDLAEAGKRRALECEGLQQRWRGTARGVGLALDIVTEGAYGRGEIVVVENFRLRRTMASLIGVERDDRDHPLTLGSGSSASSVVGDGLVLSDADAREFLALFAPELASADEAAAVRLFFERFAHRVSVLLHPPAIRWRTRIEEALARELPAHLEHDVFAAPQPFVLGRAPLLDVDTWIDHRPPFRPFSLDVSPLGRADVLVSAATFLPERASDASLE